VETVPIIGGTGALGFGLARRFAHAGVPVVIGSRDAGRAQEAAGKAGDGVEGLENAEAARQGPIVLLTVPFRAQSENLTNLKNVLQEGQILVDATVPLAAAVSGKATRLLGVPQGSAAQQAQEMVPDGVTVVSALHTLSAPVVNDLERELDEDVLIAGDKREPKKRVAELVERIPGLRAVNAGALETARFIEGLTPLLISVNIRNKTHAGVKLTGIPEDRW
jgi:8-hydroxy-5-deazaflavin:NADPH oxidoreductase